MDRHETRSASRYASLGVDAIVDLEPWDFAWVPPVPDGAIYVSFPLGDDDVIDPKVPEISAFIASLIGSGHRVLVHCTEGLNRSGPVVAKALMDMGRTANEAIKLVRDRRGPTDDGFEALCNEHFVEWLLRQRSDRSLPSLP